MGADRERPAWGSLPTVLRERILAEVGGSYVADEPAHGGFSAGYAGRVRTTAGDVFVKAVASDGHADSALFLRQEIAVLEALAPGIAPTLQAGIDDETGTACVLPVVEGRHPGSPWTVEHLHAVAEGMSVLSVTPAPATLPSAAQSMIPGCVRWPEIATSSESLAGLPIRIRDRMPQLVALSDAIGEAIDGDVIIHGDLRADNILISGERAQFLDWPHARRGAAWVDLPWFLPSVEAAGGPPCAAAWTIFEERGAPSQESMLPVIAGIASFFWFEQARPEIPQLPGLRAFQRAQAAPALRWLEELV